MRKIDELDDAVDQGVAEGYQSIEKAISKAEDCYLGELLWGFEEVDQDPCCENKRDGDCTDSLYTLSADLAGSAFELLHLCGLCQN